MCKGEQDSTLVTYNSVIQSPDVLPLVTLGSDHVNPSTTLPSASTLKLFCGAP